jgi:hypothetical protein
MVGLRFLAWMGPPGNRVTEGESEVWSYRSGNGHVELSTSVHASGVFVSGGGIATSRFCDVH